MSCCCQFTHCTQIVNFTSLWLRTLTSFQILYHVLPLITYASIHNPSSFAQPLQLASLHLRSFPSPPFPQCLKLFFTFCPKGLETSVLTPAAIQVLALRAWRAAGVKAPCGRERRMGEKWREGKGREGGVSRGNFTGFSFARCCAPPGQRLDLLAVLRPPQAIYGY